MLRASGLSTASGKLLCVQMLLQPDDGRSEGHPNPKVDPKSRKPD